MSGSGTTRTIDILTVVPPRALLLDIAGPMEVLRKANLVQGAVRFRVAYIGPSPTSGSSIGLDLAGIRPLPDELPDGALVVMPGAADAPPGITQGDPLGNSTGNSQGEMQGDPMRDARLEAEIVRWLGCAIRPGIRLATICSGAILAARAGLLDGRECTTHHGTIDDLRRAAPLARVLENRLFVEDGDRLSSAGITAGIDLMLHIVAREAGHACSLAVARYLVVYLRRTGADPQLSPFLEGRNHLHPMIHRVQDAISAEPARDWSVPVLAEIAHASPRHLSRLFNEQTGQSVTDYVNRMRVALARDVLLTSRLDMDAVAERAGFGSARQFRRAWSRHHDGPPSRVRQERNED